MDYNSLANEKNPLLQPKPRIRLAILVIGRGRGTLGLHHGPHPSHFARAKQGLGHTGVVPRLPMQERSQKMGQRMY